MSRDHLAAHEIKSRRINEGLSPEQLGWAAGVSGHTIRRIEAEGVIPIPSIQFKLASHFGLLPLDLWTTNKRAAAS